MFKSHDILTALRAHWGCVFWIVNVKKAIQMTTSSPSRLLSNVIKGANELQAINIGNNVGEPAGYNFDNNEPVGDSAMVLFQHSMNRP